MHSIFAISAVSSAPAKPSASEQAVNNKTAKINTDAIKNKIRCLKMFPFEIVVFIIDKF